MDLDGAAQSASQAQAHGAKGSRQRRSATAGHGGYLRRAKSAVRQLRRCFHEQYVDGSGTGPAEGGPQEDFLLPGAAHSQAQRAQPMHQHPGANYSSSILCSRVYVECFTL